MQQGPQNNSPPSALPWQRGSRRQGTIPRLQEHPTCSWQPGTVLSVSPSTNQTRSTRLGCRGTAGQPRNVAAWQFPILPLVDGILPEIQPLLQLCRPVLFCHASQIDRSSPARRMQDTRGSMSYCSQIIYSQAAQVIVIATSHSHSKTICLYSLNGPTREVVA